MSECSLMFIGSTDVSRIKECTRTQTYTAYTQEGETDGSLTQTPGCDTA